MDQIISAPSHELPKPQQGNTLADSGEYVVGKPEQHNVAPIEERIAQATSAVMQVSDDTTTVQSSNGSVASDDNSGASSIFTVPSMAADSNRIEKEWVAIAKFIVNKTRNDPRVQSNQLSAFKHEYIKKRYGKDVKIAEERNL